MLELTKPMVRTLSRLGQCAAFGLALTALGEENKQVAALTADLGGHAALNKFKEQFPERFFNFGIAEQNMIGAAAGMAKEGFIPFASTFATFAAMRVADQIRVNMGYNEAGIKVVGLTSGICAGVLGATHICIEDVAVMRSIPNITVISPADGAETVKAVYAAAESAAPVYLRLTGAMNNPIVYNGDFDFEIGKAVTLKEGEDVALIAAGSMVYNSLKAAEILEEKGISASVIDMHTVKPLDRSAVDRAMGARLIVTLEEHSVNGGLGEAVAHELAGRKNPPQLLMIGIEDFYPHANEYDVLMEECGLTASCAAEKIAGMLS